MTYFVISDIDGTLTEEQIVEEPSGTRKRLITIPQDLIDIFMSEGFVGTVATGRSFPSAQGVLKAIKMDYPLITEGGAILTDPRGKPLITHHLTKENLEYIQSILESYSDLFVSISYYPFHLTKKQIAHKAKFYFSDSKHLEDKKIIARYGAHLGEKTTGKEDFYRRLQQDKPAQLWIDVVKKDLEQKEQLVHKLEEHKAIHVVPSGNIIHITNKGVDKVSGIKDLLNYLGEEQKLSFDTQIIYMGNGHNDVPVFKEMHGSVITIAVGEEILRLLRDGFYYHHAVSSPIQLPEKLMELIGSQIISSHMNVSV